MKRWLGVGTAVLSLLYAVVTGAVAWHLSRRPHAWHPEPLPPGSRLEEVRLHTHDGQTLGAWLWPGTRPATGRPWTSGWGADDV